MEEAHRTLTEKTLELESLGAKLTCLQKESEEAEEEKRRKEGEVQEEVRRLFFR